MLEIKSKIISTIIKIIYFCLHFLIANWTKHQAIGTNIQQIWVHKKSRCHKKVAESPDGPATIGKLMALLLNVNLHKEKIWSLRGIIDRERKKIMYPKNLSHFHLDYNQCQLIILKKFYIQNNNNLKDMMNRYNNNN